MVRRARTSWDIGRLRDGSRVDRQMIQSEMLLLAVSAVAFVRRSNSSAMCPNPFATAGYFGRPVQPEPACCDAVSDSRTHDSFPPARGRPERSIETAMAAQM